MILLFKNYLIITSYFDQIKVYTTLENTNKYKLVLSKHCSRGKRILTFLCFRVMIFIPTTQNFKVEFKFC